jgi:hypothetical protein
MENFEELLRSLIARMDDRYVQRSDCDRQMDASQKETASIKEDMASMKTMMKVIVWIVAAFATAGISAAVKYLFGG